VLNSVFNNNLHCVEEVIESHGAVLLVLGLSEGHTLLNDLNNLGFGGLGSFELSFFLRGLLGLHQLSKSSQFFILLKIELFNTSDEISQIESWPKFNNKRVRSLGKLDLLNFCLLLGTSGILETRHLAHHLHVTGKLELTGLDEVGFLVHNGDILVL
jgi:hypothetical protein